MHIPHIFAFLPHIYDRHLLAGVIPFPKLADKFRWYVTACELTFSFISAIFHSQLLQWRGLYNRFLISPSKFIIKTLDCIVKRKHGPNCKSMCHTGASIGKEFCALTDFSIQSFHCVRGGFSYPKVGSFLFKKHKMINALLEVVPHILICQFDVQNGEGRRCACVCPVRWHTRGYYTHRHA